uniref:Uncharacterized protein n=1 Tax=Avena sativa TaxID=4498 RepID=A0ACD5X6B6_AVESA
MPRAREPCCPWSDGLPPELLDIILRYLTCHADRVYFAAVCRAWRSAAHVHKALPCKLPWLLLPSPVAPSFLSLHSGATRRLYLPESVRAARLCGSHEGGWVALAFDQWRGYAAVNLCSGAKVPLPDRLRIPSSRWIDADREHPMVIRTITFSGTPSAEGCLAAAHVSSTCSIAFWRTGMDRHWIAYRGDVDHIQDIIYYKGGFHVLSNTEDVVVYTPNVVNGASLVMSRTSCLIQKRDDYKPDSRLPKSFRMSRYLVESRGKLLMVLRLFRPEQRREFRIFEMNLAGAGGSEASWVELHALPGRVLLLGRGCSRAFEVSQSDRLPAGNIYYLDDTSFSLSLALSNGSTNSSTDMGVHGFRKTLDETRHARCGIPYEFTSECCSLPMWFIP